VVEFQVFTGVCNTCILPPLNVIFVTVESIKLSYLRCTGIIYQLCSVWKSLTAVVNQPLNQNHTLITHVANES